MANQTKYDGQTPFDFMLMVQNNISGLFDFLVENGINYNNFDFYTKNKWKVKVTQKINIAAISSTRDLDKGGASFSDAFNESFDI